MNKTELALKLAKKTGLSNKDAKAAVDAIFDARPGKGIIAVELDAGKKVTVPGFGTFRTVYRSARMGRNPKTGARIQIPAKKYPVFRAGKTLKDRVSV
jgi:DNA-binding protein HU-beta